MLESHPAGGRDLVAKIPRLEGIAETIAYQQKGFDETGTPSDSVAGTRIPLGTRLLKVALDYNTLKWTGLAEIDVTIKLCQRLLPIVEDPTLSYPEEAIVSL
jgi:response regulator RpfG family c-di-GMP phosphodiesterase